MKNIEQDYSELKVSVIIPTYKRDSFFIKRCLESVLNQTYKNIEAVVVDDNAETFKYRQITSRIIDMYNNDERLLYIQNEKNMGAALTRNIGIESASGDYITFLDDDDVYLPEKIEKQLGFMLENDLDMSFTDLGLYNMKDKLIDYRKHDYVTDWSNDNLLKLHIMHNLTGTPTYMIKAGSLKLIGEFDQSILSEEYYLMEKAINSDLRIGYLPGCYVKAYRHNMGGESFGKRKIKGEKLLFKRKKEYFGRLSLSEKRYATCRYLAVMTVSCYRGSKYFCWLFYGFLTFLSGIDLVIKEMIKKQQNLIKYREKSDG